MADRRAPRLQGGASEESSAEESSAEESSAEESSAEESSEEAPEESSEAESSQEAEGGSGEVPTLVYWTVGGTPADDFEENIAQISDYTEEKIGVRLDVKIAAWDQYDTKMNTIVNTGEYFDLMFTNNTNYSKFVNLGAFEDITDLVQSVTPELFNCRSFTASFRSSSGPVHRYTGRCTRFLPIRILP